MNLLYSIYDTIRVLADKNHDIVELVNVIDSSLQEYGQAQADNKYKHKTEAEPRLNSIAKIACILNSATKLRGTLALPSKAQ